MRLHQQLRDPGSRRQIAVDLEWRMRIEEIGITPEFQRNNCLKAENNQQDPLSISHAIPTDDSSSFDAA